MTSHGAFVSLRLFLGSVGLYFVPLQQKKKITRNLNPAGKGVVTDFRLTTEGDWSALVLLGDEQ